MEWARMWHPEQSPFATGFRAFVAYLFVLVIFRLVGRRELAQTTTHEIVLLFFVGTALRQTIVGNDPSLTSGFIGFATIVVVDALARWLTYASPRAAWLINGPTRTLVRDGCVDHRELRRAHISLDHLVAALRCHGREHLEEVHLATLERSGHISFIFKEFASRPTGR